MKIRVLMITHNRAAYTRLSLRALCDSLGGEARAVVWDNASNEETKAVLKEFEGHPRIEEIVYHPANEKLRQPTNWFWEKFGDADFLGKVDDDCVVPAGWCEVLTAAHKDIPEAGAIACWHFLPEDFNEANARKKIVRFGRHSLLKHCWINGSGYLLKRRMVEELGPLGPEETFTDYCMRGALRGYVHGWYFPFIYQQHLDDPRLENTGIRTNGDLYKHQPLSAQTFGIATREDWIKRLRYSAQMLQMCSYEPSDYVGLSAWLKRKLFRVGGKNYIPLQR